MTGESQNLIVTYYLFINYWIMKVEVSGNGVETKKNSASANSNLLVVPISAGTTESQTPVENNNIGSLYSSSSTNSENGQNLAIPLHKTDLDYLAQLLKDKKQLCAFPNVFVHVERLIDEEINRVRTAIFQCEFSREPLHLPEPIGDVSIQQEKVFVPVHQYPDYNFVGRILGPRGMTAKQLEAETGCKIMVRGRGSMRDKTKEEMNRGKPNWEHLSEDLHVIIQCEDTLNRCAVKMARAREEVNKLMVPQPEGEDELKRKQLMELAIINGTFRNSMPLTTAMQGKSVSSSLLQLDQRYLLTPTVTLPSTAGLTGTPLILPPVSLFKAGSVSSNPMPLATAQPLVAAGSLAQQTQQALLQLSGMSNGGGIFTSATPAPYGLALPQTNATTALTAAGGSSNTSQLDLLTFGQIQPQHQQLDSNQLTALLQQQQLALLQQANGIAFGEYAINMTADTNGALLSGQRRFIGHSRDGSHPYGIQSTTGQPL